jgi:acetyl-CoA synthetase
VGTVVVVRRAGLKVDMREGRDRWWHEEMSSVIASAECPPVQMRANDPLFILYTSGSTGSPKGIVHSSAGYLLYAALTHKWVFDIKADDVWFCTADIGWITGHTYGVYGPLLNGCTSVIFEGVPTFPEPDRYWRVCERHSVTGFYTAPTVIRTLMRYGDEWTRKRDLSSLRVLGSVGEPISPEAWLWYYEKVGGSRCPVLDTWWQTETGGIMISPLAGASPMKPGSAGFPFPGVVPAIMKDDGTKAGPGEHGKLVIEKPWPGMLQSVWKDRGKYVEAYWSRFPGVYYTGDGAVRDEDGFYWITGRTDDVMNVSGHRLASAEIESAAAGQGEITEAAAVGFPHDLKGQGIYLFASVKDEYFGDYAAEERIAGETFERVSREIGHFARPDIIQFTRGFPKTRSGKIMRRVLRSIVEGRAGELGDVSTMADSEFLQELIAGAQRALDEFDYDKHLEVILTGYPYRCDAEGDKLVGTVCVHRYTE